MLKLYSDFASWWPLISPPEDYIEEAAFYTSVFQQEGLPPNASLLELGAGGGSNAYHFKHLFKHVTLTDLSGDVLAMSQLINPTCEHITGDMRTLRLNRLYDVVFVHDAINYMTTEADLQRAFETACIHARPGGYTLFVPDYVKETFQPTTGHHGHDGQDRALRYIEWAYDPDPTDTTYTVDYVYLLRQKGQPTHTDHEQHIRGLYPRQTWLDLLTQVGFHPQIILDSYNSDHFLAHKPHP